MMAKTFHERLEAGEIEPAEPIDHGFVAEEERPFTLKEGLELIKKMTERNRKKRKTKQKQLGSDRIRSYLEEWGAWKKAGNTNTHKRIYNQDDLAIGDGYDSTLSDYECIMYSIDTWVVWLPQRDQELLEYKYIDGLDDSDASTFWAMKHNAQTSDYEIRHEQLVELLVRHLK